jgi:hypothetical protein
MANKNEEDIEQWMAEVAKERKPNKRMIYDKTSKKLIAVEPDDPRVGSDEVIEFIPEEAKRFNSAKLY